MHVDNTHILGAPFNPIIHKDKSRVTAVSVSLAWEAKFNGGYQQTLTIMYGLKGRGLSVLKTGIKDPGVGNIVYTQLLKLTGETCYQFQITSNNQYSETSISKSNTVELCTKGMVGDSPVRLLFRKYVAQFSVYQNTLQNTL